MRKPRDIDAELNALATRAKQLKQRKISQLGELVIATGADALEPEMLAGVLLMAVAATAADQRAEWSARGRAFFQGAAAGCGGPHPRRDAPPAGQDPGLDAAG